MIAPAGLNKDYEAVQGVRLIDVTEDSFGSRGAFSKVIL